MNSANNLSKAGIHRKEDIFRKLKFSIEQKAAFDIWMDWVKESNYRQGFEDGKEEIQSSIRTLINAEQKSPLDRFTT